MCILDRTHHRKCGHLGKRRGFDTCQWFDLNEELMESGMLESNPLIIFNLEQCRKHSNTEYYSSDTLCVFCRQMQPRSEERPEGRGQPEEQDEIDDETRDTIAALFPTPLYDPETKVQFSIGPSSSGSSGASSQRDSSRPPSWVDHPPPPEPLLADNDDDEGLPYPPPDARIAYPVGDMTLEDATGLRRGASKSTPQLPTARFSSSGRERERGPNAWWPWARFQEQLLTDPKV